jgi:uncharacterized protein YndB with AHSA1/START domain
MPEVGSIFRELTINADQATVFSFFTDPDRLVRWIGVSAQLDARPGGLMLVEVNFGRTARGEFKEVVPVSHLAYTWGWEEGHENVAPGSSLIEIDLSAKNGGTLVRFKHSGLPHEAVPGHTRGWNHYLERLSLAASGVDPGPDPLLKESPTGD